MTSQKEDLFELKPSSAFQMRPIAQGGTPEGIVEFLPPNALIRPEKNLARVTISLSTTISLNIALSI